MRFSIAAIAVSLTISLLSSASISAAEDLYAIAKPRLSKTAAVEMPAIEALCRDRWAVDFSMLRYCLKQQTAARAAVAVWLAHFEQMSLKGNFSEKMYAPKLMMGFQNCHNRSKTIVGGFDYEQVEHCVKEQVNSLIALKSGG